MHYLYRTTLALAIGIATGLAASASSPTFAASTAATSPDSSFGSKAVVSAALTSGSSSLASPFDDSRKNASALTCPAYDGSKVSGELPLQSVSGGQPGSLAGSFTVGGDGAANYSLALEPIAGPGGMTPKLSLDYSSRSGDGYLGVGFSLSGVTMISRCPKTITDDEVAEGVNLHATDKLCLGDLSLVLESGTYGAPGAVYRTDPETFARVTAVGGTSADGALGFEMRTKDGMILTYGEDDVAGGLDTDFIGSVRTNWPLTVTRDRWGNMIRYRYLTTQTTSPLGFGNYVQERRLDEIQYGNFSNGQPDRRVKFSYGDRLDRSERYVHGVALVLSRRLTRIDMQLKKGSGYANARSYQLAYQNSGPTVRSKLDSIKYCGTADHACLPPTRFEWSDTEAGDGFAPSVAQTQLDLWEPTSLDQTLLSLDMLGDGTPELAYQVDSNGDSSGGWTWRILGNLPELAQPGKPWQLPFDDTPVAGGFQSSYAVHVIDYNLDGAEDLLPMDSNTAHTGNYSGITPWRPLLSTPDGFNSVSTPFLGPLNQIAGAGHFVDLNGDGYQDALQFFPESSLDGISEPQWRYSLRSGTVDASLQVVYPAPNASDALAFGPAVQIPQLNFKAPSHFFVLDRDGDGRGDIFFKPSNSAPDDSIASGANLMALEIPNTVNPTGLPAWVLNVNVDRLFVDYNGDGLIDLLTDVSTEAESHNGSNAGRLYLWQNTGRGFAAARQVFANSTNASLDYANAQVVDANGDGRSDLLVPNTRKVSSSVFDLGYIKADAMHLLRAPFIDNASAVFITELNAVSFKFENKIKDPDDQAPPFDYVEYFPPGMTRQYLQAQGPRVVDADGDGLDDLVWVEVRVNPDNPAARDRRFIYKPHAKAGILPDRLTAVYDSMNPAIASVSIAYTSLAGDPEVYERGTNCNREHYNCAINPYHVVSRVERDAGLNGAEIATRIVSTYTYRNSITHRKSRRWLGFAEQRVETVPSDNSQPPTITRHFYSNRDEQRDPRLNETWTYSTLPDGRWWLERYRQDWTPHDTTLPNGKVLTYNYREFETTSSYRFPQSLPPDNLTPTMLDLELANTPPLSNYRFRMVLHDQVITLGTHGNVTKRRSFYSNGVNGHFEHVTETDYLPADTTAWLISRPKATRTYWVSANCDTTDDDSDGYTDCRALTERTTEVESYASTASGQPTTLPKAVRNYHSVSERGQETYTEFTYDGYGNAIRVAKTGAVDEAGTQATRATCSTYDPDGVHVHATKNDLGHVAYSKADPLLGLQKVKVDANGRRTLMQYDQLGRLVKTRAPNGAERYQGYASVSLQGSLHTETVSHDATGRRDSTRFDRMGRSVWESSIGFDGVIRFSERAYDALGTLRNKDAQPRRALDSAIPARISYTYDSRGRMLSQMEPNDFSPGQPYLRTWAYEDSFPHIVTYTDTRGHVTEREYGSAGHLGRVTEAKGTHDEVTREYRWGPFGLGSSQVVGVANTKIVITYDDRGNVLTRTDPDRGDSVKAYNAFGELILSQDANGRQSRSTFDTLGRLDKVRVTEVKPSGSTLLSETDYTYDVEPGSQDTEYGQLTRIQRDDYVSANTEGDEQRTQIDYDYEDSLGLLREARHTMPSDVLPGIPTTYRLGYDYDLFGRTKTIEYPRLPGQSTPQAGLAIDYDYTAPNGQLRAISSRQGGVPDGDQVLWALSETDGANRPRRTTTGDGVTALRNYDSQGRQAYQLLLASTSDFCWQGGEAACKRGELMYEYDGESNLRARIDFTQGNQASGGPAAEVFGYDALDRLTVMSMDTLETPWETWTYDKLGNLQSNTYRGSYTYGDPLRPMRVTKVAGGTLGGTRSFGYDAVGNQIGRPGGSVVYNELNLPARILDSASKQTAAFLYGPDGVRVRKHAGDTITTYVGGLYEQVRRGAQVEHRFNVPGIAMLPYTEIAGVVSKKPALFLHTDHQGSIDTITADDAAGPDFKAVVKERRSYDAYGLKRNPNWLSDSYTGIPRVLVNQGYTGHNDDPELGLIDMKGRIYDPTLARFLTPDPLVPNPAGTQDWNPYAYVLNNPLKYTDPSGFLYDAYNNGTAEFLGASDAFWEGGTQGLVQYGMGRGEREFESMIYGRSESLLGQALEAWIRKTAPTSNGFPSGGVRTAQNASTAPGQVQGKASPETTATPTELLGLLNGEQLEAMIRAAHSPEQAEALLEMLASNHGVPNSALAQNIPPAPGREVEEQQVPYYITGNKKGDTELAESGGLLLGGIFGVLVADGITVGLQAANQSTGKPPSALVPAFVGVVFAVVTERVVKYVLDPDLNPRMRSSPVPLAPSMPTVQPPVPAAPNHTSSGQPPLPAAPNFSPNPAPVTPSNRPFDGK